MVEARTLLSLAALAVASPTATASAETSAPQVKALEVEDPSGAALDRFFTALTRTKQGQPGAITRVAHYGDSIVVVDQLTATIRRLYQERYGDGGPGFVLALRPWAWYRRRGVRQGASEGWRIDRSISGGPEDRAYGYGGVSFQSRGPRRELWVASGELDGSPVPFSSADLYYYKQPGGGDLELSVDGEAVSTLKTEAAEAGSAFHRLELSGGPHKIELSTSDLRPVRLFGLALERSEGGHGVVWDSLGLNGTCMTVLGRMDHRHLAEQMGHRRPDLVVLSFGPGEAKRPGLVRRYQETMLPILRGVKAALQGASCLIVSPIDRGTRGRGGVVKSYPTLPTIVEDQRALAEEIGCAFYNQYEAVGGEGAVDLWVRAGLVSGDLTHPTRSGAELLGRALFEALERAFEAWSAGQARR